jgi:hypothetical protein
MRLHAKDQESILNISHSKLYDMARKLRLQSGSYHDISALQSDQEYINIPNRSDYVAKVYEESNPGSFVANDNQYNEPYNPQIEQISSIIIQRQSVHLPQLSEPVSESFSDESDIDDNSSYNPDIDRAFIEYAIDELNNSNIESIDDLLDEMPDPHSESNLESILAEAMPDQMTEMPEMDQMQEQEPQMDLEMIVNGFFFPGG